MMLDVRMVEATNERIAELERPDVALVALALNLAAQLDDPDKANAAAAREYRATMLALSSSASKSDGLDDLLGDE